MWLQLLSQGVLKANTDGGHNDDLAIWCGALDGQSVLKLKVSLIEPRAVPAQLKTTNIPCCLSSFGLLKQNTKTGWLKNNRNFFLTVLESARLRSIWGEFILDKSYNPSFFPKLINLRSQELWGKGSKREPNNLFGGDFRLVWGASASFPCSPSCSHQPESLEIAIRSLTVSVLLLTVFALPILLGLNKKTAPPSFSFTSPVICL